MYPLVDLHCDTLYALQKDPSSGDLLSNILHVDIEKMEQVGAITSCFALFVDREESLSPWQAACALHDLFLSSLQTYGTRIRQVRTSSEILNSATPSAMLTCEEGQILEGDLSRLGILRSWGVRMASLCWNHENDLGYPHTMPSKPLNALGIEAVSEMERLGIVVDVSHLSDGGFFSVLEHAKKPFVASHSNSRACTPVSRNLSDEMLRALGNAGGVAGLNFCPAFLSSDVHASSLADMVRHAKHMRNKGGREVLAIGTDFDGIEGNLAIADITGMEQFWNALSKAGFTSCELEGMWQKNALRVFSA
ncbi:MAG TPA: membrane dipeptidase [Sphaerochaeta sp.]|nr:membrane dipeptidase [Sphaerochaeta sp.]